MTSPEDVRWLETLVWPDQDDRLDRLNTAIDIVSAEPPRIVGGDLDEVLDRVVDEAPRDATLVVLHSAVLGYLTPRARAAFVSRVKALPGHWISNEAPHVLPDIVALLPAGQPIRRDRFLTALDGHPWSWSAPHGQTIEALPRWPTRSPTGEAR